MVLALLHRPKLLILDEPTGAARPCFSRYVEAVDIYTDGSLHPPCLAILTAVSVAALGAAFALYRQRDIMV